MLYRFQTLKQRNTNVALTILHMMVIVLSQSRWHTRHMCVHRGLLQKGNTAHFGINHGSQQLASGSYLTDQLHVAERLQTSCRMILHLQVAGINALSS